VDSNRHDDVLYMVRSGDTLYKLAVLYNTTVDAIIQENPNTDFHNVHVGTRIAIPITQTYTSMLSKLQLSNQLRELWEQHVAWTRMTIISAASDNPDFELTSQRILRNASDMAGALEPFYGDANASKFGKLIHDHLTIALSLVEAAKAGDSEAAQKAENQWYENADEIANFLSSINPYISAETFKKMLYDHLAKTKAEAVARIGKDYVKDIALYDDIENQALKMADTMSNAIIRQFPQLSLQTVYR